MPDKPTITVRGIGCRPDRDRQKAIHHSHGPLTPLLEAFMVALTCLGGLTDRNARTSADHAADLAAALDEARRMADAETARFRAGLDAAKAETIRDVANHIARGTDAALTRRVRVVDPNSVLIAAAVLVGGILVAGIGGYWWGNSSAGEALRETEVGLRAAFNNGPTTAPAQPHDLE